MTYKPLSTLKHLIREKLLGLFLLLLFMSLSNIKINGQDYPVPPDSVTIEKQWTDKNGQNRLRIRISALCEPLRTFPMGFESRIDVDLKHKKHELYIGYELEHYEMSMIMFYEEDIRYFKIKGVQAVFIPFFYCGNSDSTVRVSYIILYNDKAYLKHIDFYCSEAGDCELKDGVDGLIDMPKPLRNRLIKELEGYTEISNFHEDWGL